MRFLNLTQIEDSPLYAIFILPASDPSGILTPPGSSIGCVAVHNGRGEPAA